MSEPMNPTYERTYKRYLKEALLIDDPAKRILKADCSNEYHGHPLSEDFCLPIGGIVPLMVAEVVCIEIDKKKVEDTRKLFPKMDIVVGDIRNLPFEDKSFDAVMDFSTLDHVPHANGEKVIQEYHRVLKEKGDLILVVWTAKNGPSQNAGLDQYNYPVKDIQRYLEEYFDVSHEEVLICEDNNLNLVLWRAKKKEKK